MWHPWGAFLRIFVGDQAAGVTPLVSPRVAKWPVRSRSFACSRSQSLASNLAQLQRAVELVGEFGLRRPLEWGEGVLRKRHK